MNAPASLDSQLAFWLRFMGSQNALSSPDGTRLWKEGLEIVNQLTVGTFSKSDLELSDVERKGLQLITIMRSNADLNFDVMGDTPVTAVSTIYRRLRVLATRNSTSYSFSDQPEPDFKPWTNEINIGSRFFSVHENRVKVPFYSLHHERAHLVFFQRFYSNLPLDNADLARLILLMEWFCISLDLVLAHDLVMGGLTACLEELSSFTPDPNFFALAARDRVSINQIAGRFRHTFLTGEADTVVEKLISKQALEKHRQSASKSLVYECRSIPSSVTHEKAQRLFHDLSTRSFLEILDSQMLAIA